jgi:cytochrome c oxidase subunit 2
MAVMAEAVKSDRALEDLVAYIQSLPASSLSESVTAGDAERGRGLYAVCAACHGADGRCNEALSAPGLVGLDDWYLVRQLRLFAEGLRGTSNSDTYGQQMRALAGSFTEEQTRLDLAAYIRRLRR